MSPLSHRYTQRPENLPQHSRFTFTWKISRKIRRAPGLTSEHVSTVGQYNKTRNRPQNPRSTFTWKMCEIRSNSSVN